MPYSDNMSFTERWYNTLLVLYDWFVHDYIYLPTEEATAEKSFAQLAPLPSLSDLKHNISLTLINSHRALSPPRPSMPSMCIFHRISYSFSSMTETIVLYHRYYSDRWSSHSTSQSIAKRYPNIFR